MRRLMPVLAACCAILIAPAAQADWRASVISLLDGATGESGSVLCAPGGQPGTIWGTGTYTSDSSICTAAVHYGWITREAGGLVEFRIVGGLSNYEGSTQNGITSQPYGSWDASFQITGAQPYEAATAAPVTGAPTGPSAGVETIIWRHSPATLGIADRVGESFTYHCAAGAQEISVLIGAGVYADISSICLAGVHAGVITFATGGEVTVTIGGQAAAYTAMEMNGLASMAIPHDGNSFTVR